MWKHFAELLIYIEDLFWSINSLNLVVPKMCTEFKKTNRFEKMTSLNNG